MNKLLGVLLVIIGLTVAIAPQFTDCQASGRAPLELKNGNTVPMKCHWTAIASIGAGVPLVLAGLYTALNRRKNNNAFAGISGMAGGALAILFPTALIGVCANPSMLCNMVMRPTLLATGILAIGVSALILVNSLRAEQAEVPVRVKLA